MFLLKALPDNPEGCYTWRCIFWIQDKNGVGWLLLYRSGLEMFISSKGLIDIVKRYFGDNKLFERF